MPEERSKLPLHPERHEIDETQVLMHGTLGEQLALLDRWGYPPAAVLLLYSPCLGRCFFCAQPAVTDPPSDRITRFSRVASLLDDERAAELDMLCIAGIEPATHPDFARTLARATFKHVQVMTSALPLADPATARRWFEGGVRSLAVPIYGADASTHEGVVGRESFEGLMRALDNAAERGIELFLHTLALRRTLPRLGELCAFVAERWGVRLAVAPVRPKDDVFDYLPEAPTLGQIRAAVAPLDVALLGFPACLSPDKPADEGALIARLYFRTQRTEFADVCDGCAARPTCAGVVAGELSLRGAADLISRSRA